MYNLPGFRLGWNLLIWSVSFKVTHNKIFFFWYFDSLKFTLQTRTSYNKDVHVIFITPLRFFGCKTTHCPHGPPPLDWRRAFSWCVGTHQTVVSWSVGVILDVNICTWGWGGGGKNTRNLGGTGVIWKTCCHPHLPPWKLSGACCGCLNCIYSVLRDSRCWKSVFNKAVNFKNMNGKITKQTTYTTLLARNKWISED